MSEQTADRVATAPPFGYAGKLTIATNVSDLERSIEWYRELLGCEVVYKLEEYGWCELTTPMAGVSIGLGQQEQPEVGGNVPTFGVLDIDAARKHLEDGGARFDGETQEVGGMVKLATFYDPDGNAWMLSQRLVDGS
jgi:catechol 2,3-dioxygenase-like lactoylglutathione lyase family enzyme